MPQERSYKTALLAPVLRDSDPTRFAGSGVASTLGESQTITFEEHECDATQEKVKHRVEP